MVIRIIVEKNDRQVVVDDPRIHTISISGIRECTEAGREGWYLTVRLISGVRGSVSRVLREKDGITVRQEGGEMIITASVPGPGTPYVVSGADLTRGHTARIGNLRTPAVRPAPAPEFTPDDPL